MNWEDERWIKLYTKDSTSRMILSWQSNAIWDALLRKVDRAGILDLDAESYEHAVAIISATIRIPANIIAEYLPPLISRGNLVLANGKLFIPNFLVAQEAKTGSMERQRRHRELTSARDAIAATQSHATADQQRARVIKRRTMSSIQLIPCCQRDERYSPTDKIQQEQA